MRDSKFVPYLEKLRQGTLTRSEGSHLYAMVRGFIQALDRRFMKMAKPMYKPGVLTERILAFYEFMQTVKTDRPVVYVMQAFRRGYSWVLAVLSLRSVGVAVPISKYTTTQVRYVVAHQATRRLLKKEPDLSDLLRMMDEGKLRLFAYKNSLIRHYQWYNALPWRQVLDQQIN